MEVNFILNENNHSVDITGYSNVLNLIRDEIGLKGTKEGCGEGECGACSVLIGTLNDNGKAVDYKSIPSCLLPIADLDGKHLITIEGLSKQEINPVQKTFIEEGATQCGFCTPGFIISITAYVLSSTEIENDIIDSIDGHICRCTGYNSIKKAVIKIDEMVKNKIDDSKRLKELIDLGIIPEYFLTIPDRLKKIIKKNDKKDLNNVLKDIGSKKIIAGGTDMLVQSDENLEYGNLIYVSNIKDLLGIIIEDGFINIKANTTIEEMKNSIEINKILPGFDGFLSLVSSKLIRNRGTIAGNIINASPIGDISIILISLRAKLILMNKNGKKRNVNIDEFFLGYKEIDIKKDEILYAIKIPIPKKGYKFNFEKVAQRKYLDIASCNTAILINIEEKIIKDCCISAGGVFAYPLYLEKLSKSLIGKQANEKSIIEAEDVLNSSISPISDIRGSEKYKRILLKNLLISHIGITGAGS